MTSSRSDLNWGNALGDGPINIYETIMRGAQCGLSNNRGKDRSFCRGTWMLALEYACYRAESVLAR
jgi:hypothetical protein